MELKQEIEKLAIEIANLPYCCFGDENFDNVKQRYIERPFIATFEDEERNREFDLRLKAMKLAMKILDDEACLP